MFQNMFKQRNCGAWKEEMMKQATHKFLIGFSSDSVYRDSPHTVQELKQEISAAAIGIIEAF
jgi:hypothetical protein